jgi:ATP-dependent Clp protease ATP-binding subunit ClpA
MERIVDKLMAELAAQLAPKKVRVALTDAARAWLAQRGFDPAFGARPLGRLLQKEIKDPLADAILFGPLAGGGVVTVDVDGDRLSFQYDR